jgi:hypothetical protein
MALGITTKILDSHVLGFVLFIIVENPEVSIGIKGRNPVLAPQPPPSPLLFRRFPECIKFYSKVYFGITP